MGTVQSQTQGKVLNPTPQRGPAEPPYPGPAVEYNFITTQVSMHANISFSMANNMVTTNVDSYYPILGQKYAEGFRLLTFYRIPGATQRAGGLFSTTVNIPFQGVFCRYPQLPPQGAWSLQIVKSTMVAQAIRPGLINFQNQVVADSTNLYQAIVDTTKNGGRLICVEMTGQQQGQGFSAAMQGISPVMGVDLFFEIPQSPTSERYLYQCVPCPVQIQMRMAFGTSGVVCQCDWNGMLASQLCQGWKLIEIFFDMGQYRHGAFSTSASLNSVWFFEKPASRAQDNRPMYQGTVVEHFITITGGFSGTRTNTNWEPIIQQMGNQGWELACFVETPETRMSGFGKAEMKLLMFFQRPIIAQGGPPAPPIGFEAPPTGAPPPYPGGSAPPPYPGGSAPPPPQGLYEKQSPHYKVSAIQHVQYPVKPRCNDETHQSIPSVEADVVGSKAASEDQQNEKNHYKAGKLLLASEQYSRAMEHFIQCGDDSQAIELAIETVERARDEQLTHQLMDFLKGETDKVPKDAKYLFRLYMALQQYREAARTAIIIAREEQSAGKFRDAHDRLFRLHQNLKRHKIKIPTELVNNLMILHCYLIAKIHIKKKDHLKGARMLIRVAENISLFPSHIVPIITAAVIECHKSGLKNSTLKYATMLMRPEYRSQIDAKYKRRIELIARRQDTVEEEDEPLTTCPVCTFQLPESELLCPECKNNLPFCIITGGHVIADEMTACPHCDFPAIFPEFIKLLKSEDSCPMCAEKVLRENLSKVIDTKKYLFPEEGVTE